MSLKVEQQLDENCLAERQPRIYSTGVYIVPMEIVIGDKHRFVWVVDQFDNDTFSEYGPCSPVVYASDKKKLLGL